jgi:type IV secretory pathway TrbD component
VAISNWLRISLVSAWVVGFAEGRWLKLGFGVVVWLESKPASSLKDVSGLFPEL